MSRRQDAAPATPGKPGAAERRFHFSLAAAFLLLATGIVASGYFFYAGRRQSIYQAGTDSLSAIINLKVKQLEDWLAERWSDARYMQGDPLLAPALVDFLRRPAPGAAREAILKWMRFMGGRHEYMSLMLLDRDGRVILADESLRSGLGSDALALLDEARRQGGIAMSDLLASPDSPAPHLDMAIALPARGEPQGYVHVRIDPGRFLFPLIQSWPGFSPSAETLLVRRDGDGVLFLNELRHRRKTALKLRFSLAQNTLPAVQVIQGRRLAFRGRDYRGVAVWSIGRPVPGRSWFIVAKVDRSEFERPIRRAGWLSLAMVLALILGAAALTLVYWRHQRDRFRLRQLEAEASLHLHQEKFTKAFQASPDLIIISSLADGRIVEVNDAIERLTGYTHDEVIGRTTNELQLWNDARDRERYITMLHEHGRVRDMETTFRVKSGEVRFALLSGEIISARDGRYIVGVIRDITDSRRAERDRRQALERLRRFIEANVIGVVIAAADGRIIETNDYYLDLIGYSRKEFERGEVDWRRITPREWLPADERAISELRQKGKCAPYEKEYLRRDGRRVPVFLADAMLPGPDEEIAAFVLDLSERKRAEAAQRESEGMMSFALETSRIGAWDLDLVGHTASRSLQHDRIFGYAELLPQWTYEMFIEHVVPEDRAQVDSRFQAAVAAKGDWSFECRIRRADGEIRWIWAAGRHRGELGGPATRMSGIVQDISERKQAEELIRREGERLAHILEGTRAGTWEWNVQTGETVFNERWAGIIGYTLAELAPVSIATWERFSHPDDLRSSAAALERHFRHESDFYECESRLRHRDGHWVWVLDRGRVASWTADGRPQMMFGTHQDITPQKQAQEGFIASREKAEVSERLKSDLLAKLNEAQRSARIGSWDWDMKQGTVWWSDELYRIFELDPETFTPSVEANARFVHPEDNEPYHREVARVISEHGHLDVDLRIIAAGGRTKHCNSQGRVQYDADGIPRRFFGTFMDISERKQAEQEVTRLNQRLRFLIEAIKELASLHTLEEVQGLVARSARRLCAADGATFVLRDGDQCHYADEDAIAPLWKGRRFPLANCISGWVMLNKTPALIPDIANDPRIPQEVYRPTFVRSLAMLPVHVDDPFAAVGIYWKTTHAATESEVQLLQILADAAARAVENVRLLADLDQRVQQRTAQLEASNRELEAFSYSVSHDLRAPLRAIDGFSRILAEDYAPRLDEEGKRLLGVVVANTGKMAQLIEDLLAYSRLGRTELRRGRVDMEALAREAFAEQGGADAPRIDFSISPLPPAHGDATLLRQVWQNLLGNAVKFTSRTSRRKIEVGSRRANGETAYFVRDNGAGFDVHYAHKLFTIFQRLHASDEFPGTGVGLAIVQRVLQRHGGRAWAEGRKKRGATFYFTLPEPGGPNE